MSQATLILNDMKKLGFSEYECKAYLKLLEDFPLNGYALSKNSGIPRSRIYEVLNNLIEKQLVFEQTEEKNKVYYPVDPDIIITRLKSTYEKLFDNLLDFTSTLYREQKRDDRLVVIRGRKNIVEFLKLLIKGAEKRLAVSIWEEELVDLTREMDSAIRRGVALRGIYFGKDCPYDTLVPHRRLKRYMAEKKERYLSVIIDGTHVISGIMSRGQDCQVTWTQDEGFIEVSEDYIAHDLVVNLYSASLDEEAYRKFEAFADRVHNTYFHYSDDEFERLKNLH